jgi:calcineurin-like phosphoesterase family protein
MANIWYTSDHHFGHHNIIKYCNRYKWVQTVEEMDALLIQRWNEVVGPHDTVWHLGDVFFKNHEATNKLKGRKNLIVGNHDYKHKDFLRNNNWNVQTDAIYIDHENKLVMCHYPILNWPHKYKGYIHLHGHSHGTVEGYDINAVDVGVDCWDLYPVSLSQIRNRIAHRKAEQIKEPL